MKGNNMKPHYIFDLDGTVIDSSHRQRHVAGKLDVAHWQANSTPDNIMRDTLLPLADFWRVMQESKRDIFVCTARNISAADLAFLDKHGLRYRMLLSRPYGDNTPDPLLKYNLLRTMYAKTKLAPTLGVFFDDRQDILDKVAQLGVKVRKSE